MQLKRTHKNLFNRWNNHARFSYNKTIEIINTDDDKDKYNRLKLRNRITPKKVNKNREWLLKTPKDIRAGSVFEAHKNFKSCLTSIKNNNIKNFRMHFKERRKESWTIHVPKSSLVVSNDRLSIRIYKTYMSEDFTLCEKLPIIEHDLTIHFDGVHYYLCCPIKVIKKINKSDVAISLDPGVRTFQTAYTSKGDCIKIGTNASTILLGILMCLDGLISKLSKTTKQINKRRLKNRIRKTRKRIKNLQNELHWKTINFLCKNAKTVLLPKFETKKMSKRFNRRIKSKTVRGMSALCHYGFQQKLITKALETDTEVLIVSEHYTSKTCGQCGKINQKLGGKKVFECEDCEFLLDRDYNGARNIMLRAMRVGSSRKTAN